MVTPSSSTRLHEVKTNRFGRKKSFTSEKSAAVVPGRMTPAFFCCAPRSELSEGYHIFAFSSTTPPEETSFFHCVSVILLRFTIRHAPPFPSMTPLPVMATFSKFLPDIGLWFRHAGSPSQFDSTSLYRLKSSVNKPTASRLMCRLTLLFISIGPVSHNPAGTRTTPPPF